MPYARALILLSLTLFMATTGLACEPQSSHSYNPFPCNPNPCTEEQKTWCVDGGYGNAVCLCNPGYRDYGSGICTPTDPCAEDSQCSDQRRWCLNERGKVVCGACLSGYQEKDGECREKTDGIYVGPFVAGENHLKRWVKDEYKNIFLRGVNLGVGTPGSEPGDLDISREEYRRWFVRMRELGFNCLRIYTLHFPRFYEELAAYNLAHPKDPLYVMHGVWLQEMNPSGTEDLFELTEEFNYILDETIDSAHGNREIEHRFGRAYGKYETDISQWVIGWLIGREILSTEVLETDRQHSDLTSYEGESLRIFDTSPTAVWVVAAMDHTIVYERTKYGVQRPVALSNWLETDPLDHPTENSSSLKDVASIDMAFLDPFNAPAGFFISFHVYPYYPNFVSEDPIYRGYSDEMGPNSYLGILHDLKGHYGSLPVVVAEYGVPSSWGNAHFSYSGMHHGGHSEDQQGAYGARMLNNIWESGFAGAIYFAWMDGWFKRIWLLNNQTFPPERLCLWPDISNPQQNYGLLAFDVGAPDYDKWEKVTGPGRIQSIEAASNAAFFYLRITLDKELTEAGIMNIGYDTYRPDLGESILPNGVSTSVRSELALEIKIPDHAQLLVTEAYDLFDMISGSTDSLYHSVASDSGKWHTVRWRNGVEHLSKDGSYTFPATNHEVGRLLVNNGESAASSLDAVTLNGNVVEVRIPWTLLQFTDPSTLSVMNDDRSTDGRETEVTDGIAVAVSLGGELLETARFRWDAWDEAPPYVEREKPGAAIMSDAIKSLPAEP